MFLNRGQNLGASGFGAFVAGSRGRDPAFSVSPRGDAPERRARAGGPCAPKHAIWGLSGRAGTWYFRPCPLSPSSEDSACGPRRPGYGAGRQTAVVLRCSVCTCHPRPPPPEGGRPRRGWGSRAVPWAGAACESPLRGPADLRGSSGVDFRTCVLRALRRGQRLYGLFKLPRLCFYGHCLLKRSAVWGNDHFAF